MQTAGLTLPVDHLGGAEHQDLFIAAAKEAGINLVLAGHNHSYTRASFGDNVGPGLPSQSAREALGTPRDVEMVVVVSISGAMSGTMTSERFSQNETKFSNDVALERWANNTPTYQIITVAEDALTYRSHLATSAVYDSFSLTKLENGTVQMTNGSEVFGATRRFETTGPYEGKEDLR
ncbi:MAG: hypothetical protein AAFX02_05405 [Pseudomonadota bacterium]